jgi:hypothetical protein
VDGLIDSHSVPLCSFAILNTLFWTMTIATGMPHSRE